MTTYLINPTSLYTVVCRPALPKDTNDVLESTTKYTWDGGDYISYVGQAWLADSEGLLAVAEHVGRAVGIGKLTLLSPGQWWLEGLRVNPEYEDRKIGAHLNDYPGLRDYLLDHWLEHGNGFVRLVTASFRFKVHHLCERSGFLKIGLLTPFIAPILQ